MTLGDIFWGAINKAAEIGEIHSVRLQAMARWNMRAPPGMNKVKWCNLLPQTLERGASISFYDGTIVYRSPEGKCGHGRRGGGYDRASRSWSSHVLYVRDWRGFDRGMHVS